MEKKLQVLPTLRLSFCELIFFEETSTISDIFIFSFSKILIKFDTKKGLKITSWDTTTINELFIRIIELDL